MSPARSARRALGLALVVLGAAAAAGLGVWQMRRLAWKEDLLARLEAGRAGVAAPLPEAARWSALPLDELEYRRFVARGRFEPRQALVFAGPIETPAGPKPGYFVMAVLEAAGGGRLLVHRGVLPMEMKNAAPAPPVGEVTLRGLMRAPERAGWFTPGDDPARGSYFLRDPQALAPALGKDLSPFFLDEEAASGDPSGAEEWPRKGVGALAPPNNHLSYALTWFGLAIALLAVFALRARRA